MVRDAGYRGDEDPEGKWRRVYVCFDGRIESIYINDKAHQPEDIQLLVKPSQFSWVKMPKNAKAFLGLSALKTQG